VSTLRHAARQPDAPMAVTGQYLPALDGLRALAVSGVVAYHLGMGWMSGGYLGVDLFFVLSGFLITSLLLEEWITTARIRLASFWARRARRLLPALFLLLAAIGLFVVLYGRFGPPGSAGQIDLSELRGDALATLFYVANWHTIFAHQSYFAQFSSPSPLVQTWSLAIEEQFYLIWPLLLLVILMAANWRRVGVTVAIVGAAASAVLMGLLYRPGINPTLVYFGTDTHAFDLLAGVAVAMVVAGRPQPGPRARRALHLAAPVCAAALGVCWVIGGTSTQIPRTWMFDGGFLACAVLAAVIVADVRQFHQGPLAAALSIRPLRWIGMISYGIYLWHWPIIVYFDQARTGLSGAPLDLARIALTLVIATASYYLVERPLRRRRFQGWKRFAIAPAAAVVTAAAVVLATVPAVAAPPSHAPSIRLTARVAGSGDYRHEQQITVPPFSRTKPLRVDVLGDSVALGLEPGIAAAMDATGEVVVQSAAVDGFGLNRTFNKKTWTQVIPQLFGNSRPELVLATWSWDNDCTAAHPYPGYLTYICALQHPKEYTKLLEKAIRFILKTPGVSGVIFMQFPLQGPDAAVGQVASSPQVRQDDEGDRAWNHIAQSMTRVFPGKVVFLPVAGSVLLDGKKFSPWLPPPAHPNAPKSSWVRVRKIDGIHLCPAGVARYADAVLTDLEGIYHLHRAPPTWSTGAWTALGEYNTPPGSCPDDHP